MTARQVYYRLIGKDLPVAKTKGGADGIGDKLNSWSARRTLAVGGDSRRGCRAILADGSFLNRVGHSVDLCPLLAAA